jgi:arylamine N-acetyltransferase
MNLNTQEYLRRIGVAGGVHVDYESLRRIQSHHMLSVPFENHFTRNLICSVATPTGRISISTDALAEAVGSEKTRRPIRSDDERNDLLRYHFGIDAVRLMG